MTVGDMIRKTLEDGGYDGLVESEAGCSCDLNDLMPCDPDYSTGGVFAQFNPCS